MSIRQTSKIVYSLDNDLVVRKVGKCYMSQFNLTTNNKDASEHVSKPTTTKSTSRSRQQNFQISMYTPSVDKTNHKRTRLVVNNGRNHLEKIKKTTRTQLTPLINANYLTCSWLKDGYDLVSTSSSNAKTTSTIVSHQHDKMALSFLLN